MSVQIKGVNSMNRGDYLRYLRQNAGLTQQEDAIGALDGILSDYA